jgi:hypothetical protein
MHGKVYGRVTIKKTVEIAAVQIRDEQCGFRKGSGFVDQCLLCEKYLCVCEKYLEKQMEVFVAFIYSEKVYDRVAKKEIWEVLMMYGVGDTILSAIKSM